MLSGEAGGLLVRLTGLAAESLLIAVLKFLW